jgi:hypothetical protein
LPMPDHVVVVVEENHSYSGIIGNRNATYINQLAQDGASFTNSHGIGHPSQPNYLELFSGSNQGVTADVGISGLGSKWPFTTPNLGARLLSHGRTFSYTGDGDLSASADNYRAKEEQRDILIFPGPSPARATIALCLAPRVPLLAANENWGHCGFAKLFTMSPIPACTGQFTHLRIQTDCDHPAPGMGDLQKL